MSTRGSYQGEDMPTRGHGRAPSEGWEKSINRRGGRDTRRRRDRDCESWFRETVCTTKHLYAATRHVICTFI